jgi:hypothetical protein
VNSTVGLLSLARAAWLCIRLCHVQQPMKLMHILTAWPLCGGSDSEQGLLLANKGVLTLWVGQNLVLLECSCCL